MPEFKITASVLPGENFAVALLNYCEKVRETMSQENRDKQDAINLRFLDFLTRIWVEKNPT